jgi:hypothetical protein
MERIISDSHHSNTPSLQHSTSPSLRLLSIGDRIRPGRYKIHSRFHRVTNFIHGSDMVFLAEESVGGGPLTLLIHGTHLPPIETLEINDHQIMANRVSISIKDIPRYISSIDWENESAHLTREKLEELKRLLIQEARPDSMVFLLKDHGEYPHDSGFDAALEKRLTEGVRLLQNALVYNHPTCLAHAVQTLKGCGKGLTPSGDDYLAGCLAAIHSSSNLKPRKKEKIIHQISHLSKGDNPLANVFLRMAGQDRLFEPMKVFIKAIALGKRKDLRTGVQRILSHGETSGADWAVGYVMTLESLAFGGHRS